MVTFFRSKKGSQTSGDTKKKPESNKDKESQAEGTGMFKRMKSIDDKVQQVAAISFYLHHSKRCYVYLC